MNTLTATLTNVFAIASLTLITSITNPAKAQDFLSDEAMDSLFTDPMEIQQADAQTVIGTIPLMTSFIDSNQTQNFLSDEEIDNLFTEPTAIDTNNTDTIQPTTIAMPLVDHPYPVQVGGEIRTRGIVMGEQIEYESEGAQACTRIGVIGDSCS